MNLLRSGLTSRNGVGEDGRAVEGFGTREQACGGLWRKIDAASVGGGVAVVVDVKAGCGGPR